MYHHSLGYLFGAGGDRVRAPFHFNEAESARASRLQLLANGTEVGDVDASV